MTEPHANRDHLVPGTTVRTAVVLVFTHRRFSFWSYLPAISATPRVRLDQPRVGLIVITPLAKHALCVPQLMRT